MESLPENILPSGDTGDEVIVKGAKNEDIFDVVIGHIEDIIIAPEFLRMKEDFLEKHYQVFEDCDENKHEYMSIFVQYTELIEKHIEEALTKRIPGFCMKDFLNQITAKHSEELLDGEIFDILVSFTDFLTFKTMVLDYKAAKEGRTPDLFLGNKTPS